VWALAAGLPAAEEAAEDHQTIAPRGEVAAAPAQVSPSAPSGECPKMLPAELRSLLERLQRGAKPAERVAALKELGQAKPKPVPQEVSAELLRTTILDPDEEVRKEAALCIKDIGDEQGKRYVLATALGPKLSEEVRTRASLAIWRIDDPQLVGMIVRLVTSDIRSGTAMLVPPIETLYITGAVVLPIHLPEVELIKAEGLVVVPALSALRTIAQRDFGDNPAAWNKWFEDWKQIRDVRLKQGGQ
jgi:hypothetical protein